MTVLEEYSRANVRSELGDEGRRAVTVADEIVVHTAVGRGGGSGV